MMLSVGYCVLLMLMFVAFEKSLILCMCLSCVHRDVHVYLFVMVQLPCVYNCTAPVSVVGDIRAVDVLSSFAS
jgi:hypothetical protein